MSEKSREGLRGAVAVALIATATPGCGGESGVVARVSSGDHPAASRALRGRIVVGFDRAPGAAAIGRFAAKAGITPVRRVDALALAVFDTPPGWTGRAALLTDPAVAFVEGDALEPEARPAPRSSVPVLPRLTAGDPGRTEQWYLDKIGAPRAWAGAGALAPVRVAVVDTGVDLSHPDLQGRLLPGYNLASPGEPPQDFDGHGTATAGCIGAAAGNGIGIAGVAPNARIMPVKVGWSAATIAEALVWAADRADLVSMSLSVKPASSEYPAAVETLRRAAGYVLARNVPLVCSMGNTGNESRNIPAAFAGAELPELVAIGATDAADRVAKFSTRGSWVTLAAPATSIYTLSKGGTYAWEHGTSFATPITAGVVALLLGRGFPRSPAAIKARLAATAADIDTPGFDAGSGAGRLDAARAVAY
ncbi:MAG: S8 family serine peptidase [Candidatus Sericytochromatia bacterium]|nr:S8 family serine peptidase [Candidatus Tanganyikabacteria bacterium]